MEQRGDLPFTLSPSPTYGPDEIDPPALDRAEPHSAFLTYAGKVLTTLLDGGTLVTAAGAPIRPDGFALRGSDDEPRAIIALDRSDNRSELDPLAVQLNALLDVVIFWTAKGPLLTSAWCCVAAPNGPRGTWTIPAPASEDYIFRYPLPPVERPRDLPSYQASLVAILLDCVDLYEGIGRASPKGFRCGGQVFDVAPRHPAEPIPLGERTEGRGALAEQQPLHSVAASEPAIVVLARHAALLSSVLTFEAGGQDVQPVGFGLRRTADWVVEASGHPSEVYEYLARVCNVACKFCYLFGNPANLAVARGAKVIRSGEIDTRIRHWDPSRRRALFPAQWEINEFLVDPKMPQVLRKLRERSDEPFYFITNGNPLNAEAIDLLAEVGPVHLIISINSLDAQVRSEVMAESASRTRTAHDSLLLLAERRIPFAVSIAAFPDFPLDMLAATITKVEELGAAFVRLNLPGFTREHPGGGFDTQSYWHKVVGWARALRPKLKIPLLIIPSAAEENFWEEDPNASRIRGSIPGSPAARAGLLAGDVIRRVGFVEIASRSELLSMLMLSRGKIPIELDRDGEIVRTVIDADRPGDYPYAGHIFGKYVFPHGVCLSPSLNDEDVFEIRKAVSAPAVRKAWIITSALMLPAVEDLLQAQIPELRHKIEFVLVENKYLGGNIQVLDMATVGDIALAIEAALQSRHRPDLLLLPMTGFNRLGRDLIGRHWRDLEQWFDLAVQPLRRTSRFPF